VSVTTNADFYAKAHAAEVNLSKVLKGRSRRRWRNT